MQTILGAGGVIATELAKVLNADHHPLRLVSRHPKKVNDTDELVTADLLNTSQVEQAVAGSEIVYLTVGLPYDTKIWQAEWEPIMQNVINACERHQAKLVFFDNVYMYGLVNGAMTEETLFNPCSEKGKVRARIASLLLKAIEEKRVTALIARCADFYGPVGTPNSVLNMMVIDKLKADKKAQPMVSDATVHTYAYTKDVVRAVALLGNTKTAYGQTWHLPVTEPYTGKEAVEHTASALKVKSRYTVTPRWVFRGLSLFVPIIRESMEMLYQYEYDYRVSDKKFTQAFSDFKKTDYAASVAQMA